LSTDRPERLFRGTGVSPGMALGQVLRLDSHNRLVLKLLLGDERVEEEVRRFREALKASREQLEELRKALAAKVGPEHSFILDVHVLMLSDESLVSEIETTIRDSHANAEWAVREVTDRLKRAYDSLEDPYFRERGTDIENVIERLLHNLTGGRPFSWESLPGNLILVSRDFNPSSFASMDLQKVCGLVLESGGRTSHTAIIARSLRLPAVMEVEGFLSVVAPGDLLFLSGDDGQVVLNPSGERLAALRVSLEKLSNAKETITLQAGGTPTTLDGHPIILQANTELPGEVRAAKKYGARGIGLFRSEFIYFAHPERFPSMEEQLEVYSSLAREMAPHAVTIRTLDAGVNKVLPGMDASLQPNPGMGLRGIRVSLLSRRMFSEQLEAIVRAAEAGKVEVVLPMVTSVEEVVAARSVLRDVIGACGSNVEIPLGAMIEVPATVLSLEPLAREVDFLCVGTNDLVQYMLAVDRGNPQVSHLFQPLHPSILQALTRISSVARECATPVRICGEVSSNPLYVILLIGMGFEQFSMNAVSIPVIRRTVSEVSAEACRLVAAKALECRTSGEVFDYLVDAVSGMVQVGLEPYIRELAVHAARPVPTRVP
jgi:phosphoenolpyruvate-protein phosphotransferase (PTS system enzyme I)